ncbi:class I SAM-dependent methyltransferase [Bowmanella denitrificans]|uniref:class I SAM-dependent methyltransferase n=1 Tax=Bowmanella denitrificans TaxID=366582 RepID=UPI000C99C712|nr:class I SAM-dependent methyltransferase [Bowmanella denitrificans]
MTTDYNGIAAEYRRAKLHPWRQHIEMFMLSELVGDLSGMRVLDLACGEGFHTRMLRYRGAAQVMGVDISAAMVALANEQESKRPLGIDYIRCDVRELALAKQFDLVFASYLLNYAESADDLSLMCQVVADHLKPGGRFIGINSNPDYSGELLSMRPYGFTRDPAPTEEGMPFSYRFFLPGDQMVAITNYHLSRQTHEQAFKQAGLTELQWLEVQVSPAAQADYLPGYWDAFIQYKPVVCFQSHRIS